MTMANDLAWYHFDRAVCADMRGDDAVALADARALTALAEGRRGEGRGHGLPTPPAARRPRRGARALYRFPRPAPRVPGRPRAPAREPKRPPTPPAGADKKARIAALIADLDQVFARQFGQPGGVSLGESPIVQALIEEGDEAVEPLIDDLERDTRLTRAVHFHRDFFRSRTIMGAHEAAYTALAGLLKTSFFGSGTTGGNLTTMRPGRAEGGRRPHPRLLGEEPGRLARRALVSHPRRRRRRAGRMAPGRREHRPA